MMKTMTTRKICQRDADRRVAREADEVADQHVVDDPLQPADDVRQHRRPRDLPDGGAQRPLDDRTIELGVARRSLGARGRRCSFAAIYAVEKAAAPVLSAAAFIATVCSP